MPLQALFADPILEQTYLDPGYSGHANDVWRVRTASEDVVVRAFRQGEGGGPFWDGCRALFGIDPRRIYDLEPLNALLAASGAIPVPRVLRRGMLDERPCIVVEYLPGTALDGFGLLSAEALHEFGRGLAQIHARRFSYYGAPGGHVRHALATFPARLIETMRRLAAGYDRADGQLIAALDPLCAAAARLSPPEAGALVMVDIDPSQFLGDGARITAMVDTDAYVVGPRELDFIGLEYVCDEGAAAAMARGYQAVLPFPDLSMVRPVYRYLYRLLEVQGDEDLDVWMDRPAVFDRR